MAGITTALGGGQYFRVPENLPVPPVRSSSRNPSIYGSCVPLGSEILNENLQLVEEFRERIRVRMEVGEAGRLELIRADSVVATARAAANASRPQQVVALSWFRAAIGASIEGELAVARQLGPAIVLPRSMN